MNQHRPTTWRTAILTAPRPGGVSYLRTTVASVQRAGFEPVVFAQCGESQAAAIAHESSATMLLHDADGPRGAWQNWLTAARWMRDQAVRYADPFTRFLICEDDIELCEDVRLYLEHNHPPDFSICSLYCAAPNDPEFDSVFGAWKAVPAPKRCYGALAITMTLDMLNRLLADPPRPHEPHGTDHNLGVFCKERNLNYYVHTPSLAVHRGAVSSLPEAGVESARQCRTWATRYFGPIGYGAPAFAIERVQPTAERLAGDPGPAPVGPAAAGA